MTAERIRELVATAQERGTAAEATVVRPKAGAVEAMPRRVVAEGEAEEEAEAEGEAVESEPMTRVSRLVGPLPDTASRGINRVSRTSPLGPTPMTLNLPST